MAYTLRIGENAPDFDLVGTDVDYYSLDSFEEYENLIIFFTCNHCPYVTGSDEVTRQTVEKFQSSKFKFIAINSNSKNTYEEYFRGGVTSNPITWDKSTETDKSLHEGILYRNLKTTKI